MIQVNLTDLEHKALIELLSQILDDGEVNMTPILDREGRRGLEKIMSGLSVKDSEGAA